jgi:hypothetical protein
MMMNELLDAVKKVKAYSQLFNTGDADLHAAVAKIEQHILATVREDDDTLVTKEQLVAMGWGPRKGWNGLSHPTANIRLLSNRFISFANSDSFTYFEDAKAVTWGEFRALCDLLGIPFE